MILRKLVNLNFFAMTIVCAFQVAIGTKDGCNCVCLEKSLNRKSVCQHLSNVLDELERREDYIKQLETMSAGMKLIFEKMNSRMEILEDKIEKLTPSPEPLNWRSSPKMMEDLNETWHGIKNLENKLQNVTSFVEGLGVEILINSKLELMKETLIDKDINDLQNKIEGVAYRNDTKKLNERLDIMEQKLSNPTNAKSVSHMSIQLDGFRKALDYINETMQQNMRSAMVRQSLQDVHSYKLNSLENIEEQVRFLSSSTSVLQEGLVDLHNMMQEHENTTDRLVKDVVNLVTRSSLNTTQKMTDGIEKFKTEWISNCSKRITQCSSLQSNPLASNPTLIDNLNNSPESTNERKRKMQDRLFWGCTEVRPDIFPNLIVIRRNSDKRLMFACGKKTRLIGPTFTQCQQGLWKPDTAPICVSRSTHPIIPECPEIKMDDKSSLLLIVKDSIQALFQCSDGKVLKGPSSIQCIKRVWVPNSVPECIYP